MIDTNLLRKNPEYYKKASSNKGINPDTVDAVLRYDQERRELIQKVEQLRNEKNKITEKLKIQMANQKDTVKVVNVQIQEEVRTIKKNLDDIEPQLSKIEQSLDELIRRIPNPSASDVKTGKDERDNDIIRTWGKSQKFDFPIKDHMELGEALGIIDIKRATKVSGARFYYLVGDGVLLEWALLRFAVDTLLAHGFIPVLPPVIINKSSMAGMGYLEHGGEEDMFVLEKDNQVLVGTSEQSIGPMHKDEVLSVNDLPIRYMGYSPCFRREAGSYGKDTRGIIRVHQFNKVEMFSITSPDQSDKEHELLLSIEEKLFQSLNIPYQVIKMCSGDLGAPAARKYDIEAWIPSQKKYREVTSTSTTTDFQSRRLNIKYRDGKETSFVHMLNGTAFAMGRTIVAILENYQQKDGSIQVPQVLQKYMGKKIITRNIHT